MIVEVSLNSSELLLIVNALCHFLFGCRENKREKIKLKNAFDFFTATKQEHVS